jgi:hypothetical protein
MCNAHALAVRHGFVVVVNVNVKHASVSSMAALGTRVEAAA